MAQPSHELYTVALAQIDVKLGDVDANLAKHLDYVERAKEAGASLLIFPELSLTGYYLQDITNQIGCPFRLPPHRCRSCWTPPTSTTWTSASASSRRMTATCTTSRRRT